MINLQPANRIKEEVNEYTRRRLVVGLYLLFSLLIIAIIVGASSYWLVRQGYQELSRQLAVIESRVETKEYAALNQALETSIQQLAVLELPSSRPVSLPELSRLIGKYQTNNLKVNAISYQVEDNLVKASLRGHADTRNELLGLINHLKSDPTVELVDSPIDNLIKDRDIDFNLGITVEANPAETN